MAELLFVLKKVVARLVFPLGLALSGGLVGWVAWRLWPRRRWGSRLVALCWLLLLVLSLPATGNLLMSSLERAAGDYADPVQLAALGVREVVVLGGGSFPRRGDPVDRLSTSSLQRLAEGVRLWRRLPGARLVLSGGSFHGGGGDAQAMAAVAQDWGVPRLALVLETASWDTADQAQNLRPRLAGRPFVLVTSAAHMPRALAVFRAQGLEPIPAPVGFRTRGWRLSYDDFIPQSRGLGLSEGALYEYLGRLVAWAKGLW
jgi:uncharacterized SAM-binding protein YcdF (DUF218 family)